MTETTGEMQWASGLGLSGNGEKILYLKPPGEANFKPYTACSLYKIPDHKIPGGSKGWATYQKLLKAGWKLLPSAGTDSDSDSVGAIESLLS
jgi:hypothetical protein